MQDEKHDLKEQEQAKERFVRETIAGSGKRSAFWKKVLLTAGLAAVFGVVASLVFVLARPGWESLVGPEETETESASIFPSSEEETETPEETTEEETEPEPETDPPEETDAASREELLEEVDRRIAEHMTDIREYDALYGAKRGVAAQADRSVVTVASHTAEKDWFDTEILNEKETCGVIIAVTDSEMLILTDYDPISPGEELYVKFGSLAEVNAVLKQSDGIFGIAVVSVSLFDLGEDVIDRYIAIPLGSAMTAQRGQPILAVGQPMDYISSLAYGNISYINSGVTATDATVTVLQTDISASSDPRGAILNTSGELIGWITRNYSSSSTENFLTAISLGDLKNSIECLAAGRQMPALGIRGQTVTASISEARGIPAGVYVTRAVSGRPADEAGVQAGDILTGVDGETIASVRDLTQLLCGREPGDEVTLRLLRQGRDDYETIILTATLQGR